MRSANAPKQVILVRQDLNMGVGKIAAQVAHASTVVMLNQMQDREGGKFLPLTAVERQWYDGSITKIVKWVKNESQLLSAYQMARQMQLPCSLIRDAAYTELQEPAYTTVAIGPADFEEIQKITKRFRLAN
jgi:PTH2 family peptidyl-tRNA hydrolase